MAAGAWYGYPLRWQNDVLEFPAERTGVSPRPVPLKVYTYLREFPKKPLQATSLRLLVLDHTERTEIKLGSPFFLGPE